MGFPTSGHLCPVCLTAVSPSKVAFECKACRLTFPLVDGIPVFAETMDSAYGIMTPSELENLLTLCQERGWDKGVAAFLAKKSLRNADEWAAYFTPETRAAGRLLLPANPNAKVLDLGCGIGPLSINFARHASEVVGVDHGLKQLQLLKLRALEADIGNLRVVCAGDRAHLPFAAESFDTVLLNGVLEWVASMQTGDPRQHQREFLAEVHRVLKPEGEVYIGIENRFGFTYLSGGHDEHTHLRFVTVLPRKVANLLSMIKSGKPYRVYTYSRRGYREALARRWICGRALLYAADQLPEDQPDRGGREPVGFSRSLSREAGTGDDDTAAAEGTDLSLPGALVFHCCGQKSIGAESNSGGGSQTTSLLHEWSFQSAAIPARDDSHW